MTWRCATLVVAMAVAAGPWALNGSGAGAGCAVSEATLDGGGQRVTGGPCVIDGSLGGVGGWSSNGTTQARSGYPGQLTEVTNLAVTAALAIPEGSTNQLGGVSRADDGTITVVAGTDVVWALPAFPLDSIGPDGGAIAAHVYEDTAASVTGAYLGVTGNATFLVLDTGTDDCGLYAADGIPDRWQVTHFGPNSTAGMAASTNATGRDNLFCYIADLDPADQTASFEITSVSNQPPNRLVWFRNASTSRVYRLVCSTNLLHAAWTNLPGMVWVSGAAGAMSLTDTNGIAGRFYRVQVGVPPQ